MTITEGKIVSITYTLTLDNGDTVDSNVDAEPLTYTQGSDQLIPGLEKALEGKEAGEKVQISVQAEDGYGAVSEDAFIEVPREHLPEDAHEIGAQVTAVGPQGQELQGIVTELEEDVVLIDFNHPLAGEVLHFDITILSVE